jgi:trimeric autotransporter adhesin
MKQIILLLIATIATLFCSAQNIGIGTTAPDASSKLEISSGNSGLLIPRLTAAQRMIISNPANGLLVFDTDSAAFAYRTGGTWLFLKGTGTKANDWSTSGNGGTNAGSFIGTTDEQPLQFRVNNVNAGLVDSINYNTALGFRSLDYTTGAYNTAAGYGALSSSNQGSQNTATGVNALYSNTTGNANTANGSNTLHNNNTGANNTATGVNALYSNTTGSTNTAGGGYAMVNNTTGSRNTAHGYQALELNTTGERNTANGAFSMVSNTTGSANTAIGYFSLNKNTTGMANTANGDSSLANNTTGNANTTNGAYSLYNNTSGAYNSAFGTSALQNVITGDGNTAVGYNALGTRNFTSRYNTAIGVNSGANASNGSNNIFVGYGATMYDGLENVVSIGQGTLVPTSNTVRLGNSSTTTYQCFADWTTISDGRFKNNIKENVPGLAFINKLRPVTYHLAATTLDDFNHRNYKDTMDKKEQESKIRSLKEKEQITYTGFIAQEVETAAKELGFDFSGVDKPKNDNDTYGLRYAEFVVPLVKAVQEQQQLIQKQQQLIQKQQQQIDALAKEIQLLKENPNR